MGDEDDQGAAPADDFIRQEMVKTLLTTVKQNAELIAVLNNRAAGPTPEAIRAENWRNLIWRWENQPKLRNIKILKKWASKYG